jgi:hypothetical protein
MEKFVPRLDVLPKAQQRLWTELKDVPAEFVLYGDTAIALHLGHRQSIDFDFFSNRTFDPARVESTVPFMANAEISQRAPNTLTGIVDRSGLVQVSFFGIPNVSRIAPPHVAADNGLKVASLLDLAGTKVSVVQQRAEAKDYIDIDALIRAGGVDLPKALAAGKAVYGSRFSPESTLKALSFFDDGNLRSLPDDLKARLAAAVREGDLDDLPNVGTQERGRGSGRPMNPIPLNPETEQVARRVIWFEPPAQALADPVRFMAYAMSHARHEDMKIIRRYVSDDDFREALDRAPPGIIDPRSWAYWNNKFGRYPAPPLPKRQFG